MRIKKIVKFYNETTPEEKCRLAKDIEVPVKYEDGIHCLELDSEVPVCMNGIMFQINTENFLDENNN